MRRSKRALPALFLGALALCAWCMSLFFAQRAAELAAVAASWTGEGEGVSPAQVQERARWAREDGGEEFPGLTLWREHGGQTVSDPLGGAPAAGDVLEFYGDGAALWPASFLAGHYPLRGDGGGCAVDEALAFSLWGSADVLGRSVMWNGERYTIRGVFRGGDGLLLAQVRGDGAAPFPNMLLDVDDPETARALLNKGGMGGAELLDLPLLSWCALALAGLPALLPALGLVQRLLRRGWMLRHTPLLLSQYLPAALLGGGLALWAVDVQALPGRLIPTRWSDFDFWTRLAQQWGDTLRSAFFQGLGRRELAFWPAVLAAALLALCACLLLIPALERVEIRSLRALLLGGLGAMGLAFALTAAFAPRGGLVPGRAVWLLPTLWLLADGALRLHQKSLIPKSERRKQDEADAAPALAAETEGPALP